jgi:NAD(P)-dependent dehydrogenase (short-subunit alcohol dehydrogenase family)
VDEARQALTTRILPTMSLSSASNPLTAPLPPVGASLSAAERAAARFAVAGNAAVTGGAGTLALASARALLEHGLGGLALLDLASTLASAAAAAAIAALRRDFPHAAVLTVPADVTDETQVAAAMRRAADGFGAAAGGSGSPGRIDILCCFAGVVGCVPSRDVAAPEWRRVVDVNLTGAFLCAQAAAQHMLATAAGGSILFIASISAQAVNYPQPQAAYNVSKAGVRHLTRCLAAEWAVHGIRVNCISPGYMDTVLNAGESLRPVRDVWASRCPMGRMGDVEELTGAVVMLCAQRSARYITGADIVVDGGAVCF